MQNILITSVSVLLIIAVIFAIRSYIPHNKKTYRVIKKNNLLYVKVKINRKPFYFLLDTGSEISFISSKVVNKLKLHSYKISHQEALAVEGISSQLFLPLDKYCDISINMCNWFVFKHILYVTDLSVDGILGMDWILKNKASINTQTLKLEIFKNILKENDLRSNKSKRTV